MSDAGTSKTAIVVGASSGFGRETALALSADGWRVAAIARSEDGLRTLVDEAVGEIIPIVGDARDDDLARAALVAHDPTAVVIGGGVPPHMAPLHEQTWDTLSMHWESDVAIAFNWLSNTLRHTPPSLDRVVVISSGAALSGSPGSGGYAGAKAATRWLTTASASQSAQMQGLPITFTAVMPQLTHDTAVGRAGVGGYAEMGGGSSAEALDAPVNYTAADGGRAIAGLVNTATSGKSSTHILGPGGLSKVDG
jgi:NAD(P)-dependent dehydrogenase (short-subunit alcohol dehydrogenase family)